jgi:hypothetical protein
VLTLILGVFFTYSAWPMSDGIPASSVRGITGEARMYGLLMTIFALILVGAAILKLKDLGSSKTCPYCQSSIHRQAVRCPRCQADLGAGE